MGGPISAGVAVRPGGPLPPACNTDRVTRLPAILRIVRGGRSAAGEARVSPGHLGGAFRVGGGDVAHGGLLGDAEQTHQSQEVGAFGCFVEDAVLAQTAQERGTGHLVVVDTARTAATSSNVHGHAHILRRPLSQQSR